MTMRSWLRNLFARPANRTIRKQPSRVRLAVEALEDRCCPSTFAVFNTQDDGNFGSLRWAVDQANANPGPDTIIFAFNTPQTITLGGSQLELSDQSGATTITGPSQSGTVTGALSPSQFSSIAFVGSDPESIIGQTLTFTSGDSSGASATVQSFDPTTGTFTFVLPFFGGVQSGDAFTVNPGAGVTISGGGLSRVFQVDSQVVASFSGLTITDGAAAAGGGVYNLGTVSMTDCTLSGNSATSIGGGLDNPSSQSQAFLTNCTISGNSVASDAATITAVISNKQFSSSALVGSLDNFSGKTLTFTSGPDAGNSETVQSFDPTTGTFTFAHAFSPFQLGDAFTVSGAAQGTAQTGSVTTVSPTQFTSSAFIGSTANFIGQNLTFTSGADNGKSETVTNFDPSTGTFSFAVAFPSAFQAGDTFSVNPAPATAANGGLVTTASSTTQLTSSTFIGSTKNFIGQLFTFTSGADIGNSETVKTFDPTTGTFTFVTAFPSAFHAGDAFTVRSAIQGPAQTGSVTTTSTPQFASSAFIGSTANFIGQTLTFTSGADNGKSGTVTNFDPSTGTFSFAAAFPSAFQAGDTFSVNPALATAAGGGLANSGLALLSNCTVSANTAANLGGGLLSTGAQQAEQLVLANTIVAGNTAPAAPDVSGSVVSLGSNLIGKTDGSSGWVPAYKETVSSAGSATVFASSALVGNANNFVGQTLTFTSGADKGKFGTVANFDPTTGIFTLAQAVAQTGTISAVSSTTKFISSAFIGSAGNFVGQTLTFTSGNNKNSTQLVTKFDSTTGAFTFAAAFASPFQAGDAFTVESPPQAGDAFTVNATTGLTGTVANPLNPMLGSLADNGGPTQTMALLTGSLAINAGNTSLAINFATGIPSTTDQRGVARTGPVDIGAYESSVQAQTISILGLPPVVAYGNDLFVSVTTSSDLPVTVTASGDATVSFVGGSEWKVHPTGVGSATITATAAAGQFGGVDFSAAPTVTQTLIIGKGIATITPKPYTSAKTTYDGNAHTATATATGVGGVDLSADLTLSGTTHTNPGSYTDTWTFHDPTGTYQDASGTITDSIGKANATVVVTPYTVTYDGAAHQATLVSITGVANQTGAAVGAVDLSTTTHINVGPNAGGAYSDSYTFTGTAFYNNATVQITDTIGQASATITPTPYTSANTTYDGNAHTATGTATGVGGVPLATSIGGSITTPSSTTQFTSSAFIGNKDRFIGDLLTFTSGNNNNASGTIQSFDPTTGTFTFVSAFANAFQAGDTFSITGLNFSGTTHTSAGTYTDTWTFHDLSGNYQDASGQIADSIAQANALIIITPYNTPFDGNPHTATIAIAVGIGGVDLSSDLDLSGTTHTSPGFYPDTWTFHDASGNYQDATGTVDDSIAQNTLTVQPTDWMGQLADSLPLTDLSLPGTYNSASGPSVADALFGDSSAGVVGAPDALSYAASGLHLTAAVADSAAEIAGGDNTTLNNAAIVANAAATAADAAAGVTDTVSGLAMVSDTAGLASGIADAVQAHLDAQSAAANTAATAVNSTVAASDGETTAAAAADGAAETANTEAEVANQTALGSEGAAEGANAEAALSDEAAKDADQVAADQGDVDPVADETAAGLDEAAVTEDGIAAGLDQTAVLDDTAADVKDTATVTADAANGEAATANGLAAADETAAEAPDAAAATNNLKSALSAGASSLANFTASGADGVTAGEFTSYANEINPATTTAVGANATEQATLYGLAVTEATTHTAASIAEFAAGTADAKAAAADFKASTADGQAVTAVTAAAAANAEATAADTAAEEKDAAALTENATAEVADEAAEIEDAKAAGLDQAAGALDAAAGEADTEAAAADAEAVTLDAEAIAADIAAPIADAAAAAADAAAVTADGVAVGADIVAAAQAGLDPVADGIAVAADIAAGVADAAAAAADAAAVAADAAVVADDAAALAADGEAAAEDAKAGIEDGLAVAADEAAFAEDAIAEAKDAEAVTADTAAVAADEAATAADSFAEEKDAEAVTADTEAANACEQANLANEQATSASEAADAANQKATIAGAAATAADIAFMTEVAKVQGIVSAAQTQNSDIADQLSAGIRSLDLHATQVNDTINLNDGQYFTGVTLQSALNDMTSYLQAHPTETIVVTLKSNENPGGPMNSVNSFNTDLNNLLSSPDSAVQGSHTYNDFMYYSSTPTTTPTLGQVRGKIVIMPAPGDPWTPTANPVTGQTLGWQPTQVVQDTPNMSDPAARWNLAENNGNGAGLIPTDLGNQNTLYRNNLSLTGSITQPTTDLGATVNAIAQQAFTGFHVTRTTGIVAMDDPVSNANVIAAIINQNNLPIIVTSDSDAPAFASAFQTGDAFKVDATGTVTTAPSATQLTSSSFIGSKANFIGQTLTFTSGADNGKSATVKAFNSTTGTFTFTTALPSAFLAGDAFTVYAIGTITTMTISPTQFNSSSFIGSKENFIGQPLTFTSGANNGKSATITNFNPTTGTFTFTSGAPGTLRAAILQADSQPGVNTIEFAPSLTGPTGQTIILLTDLPAITGDVNIVGPATIVTQNHQAFQHAATHTVTEVNFVASDTGPLTQVASLANPPLFVNTSALTIYVTVTQQQTVLFERQISTLISAGVLSSGNGNALISKLSAAAASFASGSPTTGVNNLTAFINEVNDFVISKPPLLTAAQAQTLISAANAIITLANPLQLVSSVGNTITANTPFSLTVTAIDNYGNVLPTYTGAVSFSDSVTGATLPAKYTFTTGLGKDNGVHTFNGLILKTKGLQTITITDNKTGKVLGTLTVNVV